MYSKQRDEPPLDKENDHYHKGIKQNCDVLALSVNLALVFFLYFYTRGYRQWMDSYMKRYILWNKNGFLLFFRKLNLSFVNKT